MKTVLLIFIIILLVLVITFLFCALKISSMMGDDKDDIQK